MSGNLNMWTCPACTYLNGKNDAQCCVCFTPRDAGSSRSRGAPKKSKSVPVRPPADTPTCQGCGSHFGMFRRRYYCTRCKWNFCSSCTNYFVQIPNDDSDKPQRLCRKCNDEVEQHVQKMKAQQQQQKKQQQQQQKQSQQARTQARQREKHRPMYINQNDQNQSQPNNTNSSNSQSREEKYNESNDSSEDDNSNNNSPNINDPQQLLTKQQQLKALQQGAEMIANGEPPALPKKTHRQKLKEKLFMNSNNNDNPDFAPENRGGLTCTACRNSVSGDALLGKANGLKLDFYLCPNCVCCNLPDDMYFYYYIYLLYEKNNQSAAYASP
eukprot:CAMPEP_0174266200 /NCGR_PEP_ID=MMETSP0439-20130205/29361_1 /TAXON_ID=0 /ORGANISM="Stereomyxa ramosa, Strain Chinc5" /LENGTH=325 /DNA_ID=CAMNT_0015353023 /DNA_START=48 /DNA_END=1022 /DNA_ORIENTATION=+